MEDKKNDVDLYAELKKTLETVDESEAEEASGSDSQKPKVEEKPKEETPKEDENAELSEEDISKLSPRAQKRIREQAAEIKRLAEEAQKPKEESPNNPQESEDDPAPKGFKNVQEFLAAVQDEPSRKLLEAFYGVVKREISTTLSPIELANNEAKFEQEFTKFEKIEGLADYKNDLKKTFLRNPNQSLKALVGEVVTDLSLSKIKPIDKTVPTPKRDGKIDIEGKSKDELYDMLDTMREN